MTVAQAVTKIKSLQQEALKQVANVALSHVMPFVPIDTGELRRSGHIEVTDASVDVVFGSSGPSVKYASAQYGNGEPFSGPEQHLIDGDSMMRLLSAIPADVKKSVKGQANKSRYGAAYRYAVKNNLLTRFPGGARNRQGESQYIR
jgi:hypothetical protein